MSRYLSWGAAGEVKHVSDLPRRAEFNVPGFPTRSVIHLGSLFA